MKTMLFIILAVIVFVVVFVFVLQFVHDALRPAIKRWRERRNEDEPWTVDEESNGEMHMIFCIKPGELPYVIGGEPVASDEFDYNIELLRSEARQKVIALNGGRELKR